MFVRESEMTPSVMRWLSQSGLSVKPEFVSPWGICDLVAVQFDDERVAHRIHLNQLRPITSITRAALLLQVPAVESRKSIGIARLIKEFAEAVSSETVLAEIDRLIADKYIVAKPRGRLQKLNSKMPLQNRFVSVELKLTRVDEAFRQAKSNLGFAEESFVAFPKAIAERIELSKHRWQNYLSDGIGLLAVDEAECNVLIPAVASNRWTNAAIQLYCVDKFWRRTATGS